MKKNGTRKTQSNTSDKLLAVCLQIFGLVFVAAVISHVARFSGVGQDLPPPLPTDFQPFIFLQIFLGNSIIPALMGLIASFILRSFTGNTRVIAMHVSFAVVLAAIIASVWLLGFATPFAWLHCSEGLNYASYHCPGNVPTPATMNILQPTFAGIWLLTLVLTWYTLVKHVGPK